MALPTSRGAARLRADRGHARAVRPRAEARWPRRAVRPVDRPHARHAGHRSGLLDASGIPMALQKRRRPPVSPVGGDRPSRSAVALSPGSLRPRRSQRVSPLIDVGAHRHFEADAAAAAARSVIDGAVRSGRNRAACGGLRDGAAGPPCGPACRDVPRIVEFLTASGHRHPDVVRGRPRPPGCASNGLGLPTRSSWRADVGTRHVLTNDRMVQRLAPSPIAFAVHYPVRRAPARP